MNFATAQKHHILIIEDDMNLNKLFASILSKNNYIVEYVTTLTAARENLIERNFNYDIILLDYHLPDGKGDLFLEWLHTKATNIPVIFISADNSNTIVMKCFKAGALDYIVKPFEIESVLKILESTLQQYGNEQHNDDKLKAEMFTPDWVELSAISEIDYLGRIQKLCTTLLSSKLSPETVEDIKLAMEEYGRNAIEWGNKFDKSKIFKISYCLFNDRIILKFEDEGDGFDLKTIPDPSKDPVQHLKSREEAGKRPGGYGIFMMKNIMDEVIYNSKGNVCVMTKYIPE